MKFRPKKLSLAVARTFSAGMAVTFVSVAYAQTPPAVQLPPKSANTWGRLLSRFSTLLTPSSLMSVAVTCVTGLVLVMFGDTMREPVTCVGANCTAGGVCA